MPPGGEAAVQNGQAAPPRQRGNPLWTVLRMGLMYFFFKNFFGGPSKPVPREEMLAPKFERGLPVDLNVYLSESPVLRYQADPTHERIDRSIRCNSALLLVVVHAI